MANYVYIDGQSFRLSVGESIEDVRDRLDKAAEKHALAKVEVVLQDGIDPHPISVNPAKLGWWSVLHTPEPGEE